MVNWIATVPLVPPLNLALLAAALPGPVQPGATGWQVSYSGFHEWTGLAFHALR